MTVLAILSIAIPCVALGYVADRVCRMLERRAVSRESWEAVDANLTDAINHLARQAKERDDRLHRVEQKVERSAVFAGGRR